MAKLFSCRHFMEIIYFSLIVASFFFIVHQKILQYYKSSNKNDFLHSYQDTQYAYDITLVGTDESCKNYGLESSYMAILNTIYPQDNHAIYATAWKNSKICLKTKLLTLSSPTFAPRTVECRDDQFRCHDYCFQRQHNGIMECPMIGLTVEKIDDDEYDPDNRRQFQYGEQLFEYKVTRAIPNDVNYPENPKPFIVSLGINSQEKVTTHDDHVSSVDSNEGDRTSTSASYPLSIESPIHPTQNGYCVRRRSENGIRRGFFPIPEHISRDCNSYDPQYSPIDTYPDLDNTDALPNYGDLPVELRYSEAYFLLENFNDESVFNDINVDLMDILTNTSPTTVPTLYQALQMPVNPTKCYDAGIVSIHLETSRFFRTDTDDSSLNNATMYNLYNISSTSLFYIEGILITICIFLLISTYITLCCRRACHRNHRVCHKSEKIVSQKVNPSDSVISPLSSDSNNVTTSISLGNAANVENIATTGSPVLTSVLTLNNTDEKKRCSPLNFSRIILLTQIPFVCGILALINIYRQVYPLTKSADLLQNSGCVLGEFSEMLHKFHFFERYQGYERELLIYISIKIFLMIFGILFYTMPCIFKRGEVCCCKRKRMYDNENSSQATIYPVDYFDDEIMNPSCQNPTNVPSHC